jgi:hypothetical protein
MPSCKPSMLILAYMALSTWYAYEGACSAPPLMLTYSSIAPTIVCLVLAITSIYSSKQKTLPIFRSGMIQSSLVCTGISTIVPRALLRAITTSSGIRRLRIWCNTDGEADNLHRSIRIDILASAFAGYVKIAKLPSDSILLL